VFSVYQVAPVPHQYQPGPAEFLVDVDDGAGARECCRFTDDPEDIPEWNGRWNGDEWGPWILERAKACIADPDDDLPPPLKAGRGWVDLRPAIRCWEHPPAWPKEAPACRPVLG
jgi:hypothetical protein